MSQGFQAPNRGLQRQSCNCHEKLAHVKQNERRERQRCPACLTHSQSAWASGVRAGTTCRRPCYQSLCQSQLGELLWHSALQSSALLPQLQHSWCLETGILSSYSTAGAWRQQFPPPSLPQQSKQPLSEQCCTKLWSGRFSCGTNEQLYRFLLPLRATKNVVPRHLRYSDTSVRTLHTARELSE